MKKILIPILATVYFSHVNAQARHDTIMYVMAASADNEFSWLNIERFDMKGCKRKAEMFNKHQHQYTFDDNLKIVDSTNQIGKYAYNFFDEHFPTSNMACGIAYSKKTRRIYFFPLGKSELRWEDIGDSNDSIKKFGKIRSGNIHASGNNDATEEGNISRATMGYNGNGYALTNDGKHLYEFTDEAIPVVTDLGALKEGSRNDEKLMAAENANGDIVGLSDGNLLLITGNGKLFFIDIKTREISLLYKVKGIHKNVIISGAAVDDQNRLIISGCHGGDGFYSIKVNKEATAEKIKDSHMPYSVSDLASSNFLTMPPQLQEHQKEITVHPNPIQHGSFNIVVNAAEGNYTLRISDQNGKAVSSNEFKAGSGKTVIQQLVPPGLASGMYYFLIYNSNNELVFRDNILVSN